jgi:hypothetical protein
MQSAQTYLLTSRPPPRISNVTVFGLQPRFGWPTTLMFALLYTSVIAGMFLRFEPAPIDTYNYWRDVSAARVTPGQHVDITTKVVAYKLGCDAHLTRRWYDTAGNLIRQDQYDLEPYENRFIEHHLDAVIPGGVTDGVLRMSAVVEFRCNPVQQVFGGSRFIFPDLFFLTQG